VRVPARVSISAIEFVPDAWVRQELDADRVKLFRELLADGVELPAPEVVPIAADSFVTADGVHRVTAHNELSHDEIDVIVIEPLLGESPVACAFRRGLETAAHASVPLRRAERTRGVRLTLERYPNWSDQQIAMLCGVSRQTVWRYRSGRCNATVDEAAQRLADEHGPRLPSADELADDLVRRLVKLDDGRGILDRINPSRMGRHLGSAFTASFGDYALDRARRFEAWLHAAVNELRKGAT